MARSSEEFASPTVHFRQGGKAARRPTPDGPAEGSAGEALPSGEVSPPSPRFPAVGEALGDLLLLAELGRGVEGRVYLARQSTLSDRPLVLKLTPDHGQEHLSLARLQHTHIVPLYWAQELPERGLRMLCMPYLGGSTLAHL